MFIGSTDGIGHRLIEAQMLFEMPTMYAAIFAAGALGYGMNWVFLTIEKTSVHWGGKGQRPQRATASSSLAPALPTASPPRQDSRTVGPEGGRPLTAQWQ